MDLAARIGLWAADFAPRTPHLERVRASVRDFAGCVMAGAHRPELRSAMRLAHAGPVRIWGLADGFDPAGACVVAGTAGALLQVHDVFTGAGLHPSSPVIPAAWAAWSTMPVRGTPREFLRAVATGYEVTNRVGLACTPGQGKAGSGGTGTAGAIGAAVAASLQLGHDALRIGQAVANAALFLCATPTAALRSHGAQTPLHSGLAARAGYEAALVAQDGGAGARVLEGDATTPGLIALLRGDSARLVPETWGGETLDALIWKFFPACYASHSALEALLRLPRVELGRIRRCSLELPGGMMWLVDSGPTEAHLYDRLMSLRWVAGRALRDGAYGFESSCEDDAVTQDLAARVEIRHAPELDSLAPGTLAANAELLTDRGTERIEHRRAAASDPADRGPRGWTSRHDDPALLTKFACLARGATREDREDVETLLA